MTDLIDSENQEPDEGYKSQPETVGVNHIELASINLDIQEVE
jgi:hypothetical protein